MTFHISTDDRFSKLRTTKKSFRGRSISDRSSRTVNSLAIVCHMVVMVTRCCRDVIRTVFTALFLIGVVSAILIRLAVVMQTTSSSSWSTPEASGRDDSEQIGRARSTDTTDSNLVLVGVLTAKKFLATRAVAAYDTWVPSIPGKVIFFSSEGSVLPSRPDIPLVALPGIDDRYPPQRKSFAMLKYIHDHYRDRFRFFMRADDDLYIRGDILGRFLHSINSTGRALYIGQAGIVTRNKSAKLHLREGTSYCMGGPGVILSRQTLVRTAPHIDSCVRNMVSHHEDVELGRCIKRFALTECTTSYEMRNILFHNYKEPKGAFTGQLRGSTVHQSATLHPLKIPAYQYRLHRYLMSRDSASLRNKIKRLHQQISNMNEVLQIRSNAFRRVGRHAGFNASTSTSSLSAASAGMEEWEFIDKQFIYSHLNSNPKRRHEYDLELGLQDVLQQMNNTETSYANDVTQLSSFEHGYRRINPLLGVNFRFNLGSYDSRRSYDNGRPPYSADIPRRTVFAHQPFLEPEFRAVALSAEKSIDPLRPRHERVNFILPLAGRSHTFRRFMDSFEASCLNSETDGAVSLTVVLFHEAGEVEEIECRIEVTKSRYPFVEIRIERVTEGAFSRGASLQRGAKLFPRKALLVFIDVDFRIRSDFIRRVRLNTVRRRQVYYPIVFSHYDPRFTSGTTAVPKFGRRNASVAFSSGTFKDDVGYWRRFGYGILAAYNEDFIDAGGFDLSINGWGLEDVRLFERFVARNVTVFRAPDVSLVHEFHETACDRKAFDDENRFRMCLGTKQSALASARVLAKYVRATPEIYWRNEVHRTGLSKTDSNTESTEQRLMVRPKVIVKRYQ